MTGPGSNQWAVAASRSAGGRALLANDPHLQLRLPNPFYRSELHWDGHDARGLGIPGLPGIIVGATDRLAWGLTVSYADQSDWVVVEVAPDDPSLYAVPGGTERFGIEHERIEVHGGPPVVFDVKTTRWGPVLDHDWRGRPLALHATWLEPDGLNLEMLALLEAPDVASAVDIASRWSGPSLNWAFADADGNIGWTVNGPLPKRAGFDGARPESWADGTRGWHGRLDPPRRLNPPGGVLFTANNRTVAEPAADDLSRMWMRPLRAKRIDDLLAGKNRLDERDLLAMQLDTRAEGYDLIRDIALEVLAPAESDPVLAGVRERIAAWNGLADPDQAGFRLLQLFYRALLERVLSPLLARPLAANPRFVYRWPLADEPLRRLLEARPPETLPAGFADWHAFLRGVLVDAVRALENDPSRPGPAASWGEVNRLDVAHPLARLPLLGGLLRLPATPLPGSMISLRVAAPDFGAVFRMVVAPGRPEAGFLEMEGGQSGHFLSPHFRDQQGAWAAGAAAPFLAGKTADAFELDPAPPP
jgi:penicillin amidase